jgi:ABC-type transport system involved in multi-copper enzyme maturation permease subunit
MRQLGAILIDAYRELYSRKLFWIILILSGIFLLAYGSIGFDDTGISMFFGLTHIENEYLTADSTLSDMLYRSIFASFVVPIWLAWIATILALISTASIFPDFVAGGSIDLVLPRPISRVRLFLFKYLASLLFVLLQVALFCIGVLLCMGLRIGDWDWKVFLAVPIVVVFYSYLYSVCTLIGVWTRSTLAALLLTLLLWFGLYAINTTEAIMLQIRTQMVVQVESKDKQIETLQASLADAEEGTTSGLESRIEELETERDETQETVDRLDRWRRPVQYFKYVLPKTSETISLLDRYLIREGEVTIMDIMQGNIRQTPDGRFVAAENDDERQAMTRLAEEYESRSLWYVIGTSLIFEAVVLALACWIFVRRDF